MQENQEVADLELEENSRWSIPTTETDENSESDIDEKKSGGIFQAPERFSRTYNHSKVR